MYMEKLIKVLAQTEIPFIWIHILTIFIVMKFCILH